MAAKKNVVSQNVENAQVAGPSMDELLAQLAALQEVNNQLQNKVIESESKINTISLDEFLANKKAFEDKENVRIESEVNTLKSSIDSLAQNEAIASLIMDYQYEAVTFKSVLDDNGNKSIVIHYSVPATKTVLNGDKRNYTVINRWKIGNVEYSGRGLPHKDIVSIVAKQYSVNEDTASKMLMKSKSHKDHDEVMKYLDEQYATAEYKAKKK